MRFCVSIACWVCVCVCIFTIVSHARTVRCLCHLWFRRCRRRRCCCCHKPWKTHCWARKGRAERNRFGEDHRATRHAKGALSSMILNRVHYARCGSASAWCGVKRSLSFRKWFSWLCDNWVRFDLCLVVFHVLSAFTCFWRCFCSAAAEWVSQFVHGLMGICVGLC